MLVLERRCGQEIIIGDTADIRVKILSQKGDIIRLGIAAPASFPIHRREIFERLQGRKRGEHKKIDSLVH